LAEVAALLSSDLAPRGGLTRIVDALRRGLGLNRCRLWVPADTGGEYALVAGTGDAAGARDGVRVPDWLRAGPHRETVSGEEILRFPLLYDGAPLGVIEAMVPLGPRAHVAHDVLLVIARLLGPLLGAAQLSRDLAFEVAQRTHEVAAQHSFVARIIDSLPVGLYVVDRAYRIRAWNRKREAGTQGVARDEALGREIFDVLDRQPREMLKREFDGVFQTGEMQQMEMESQSRGGARYYRITKIPMRIQGDEITHVITIGEDVTEWRQAQQQLAQTEKLAAVGQLAAGVMHEINNPLATILACTEALALRADSVAPRDRGSFAEYLKIIDTEVQRCRRIVDGLLAFSHPRGAAKRRVAVNDVVEQTLFLLKHHDRFRYLSVVRELAPGLPELLGDGERLVQGFMALMLNAMDAMEARGVLTVRTQMNPWRSDEVLVEFIDTGQGIPQEQLPKIFEPFYTTKPQGRGTGLGLSICYGIIQEHRGRIEVESQLGVGSDFKVYLPTE